MPRPGAKVQTLLAFHMSDEPVGDGSVAWDILNFRLDDRGFLDSTFRLMPLIPNQWRGASPPAAFGTVRGMGFWLRDGVIPEIIFVTSTGVFRYAPWRRGVGGTNPGLEEVVIHRQDTSSTSSVQMTEPGYYPPDITVVGNRVYLSFCDGGSNYVWDGTRLRPFGFTERPAPPNVLGPSRDPGSASPNAGGFSVAGRIGTIESDWLDEHDPAGGANVERVGGIDDSRHEYAVVFENTDGAYSARSAIGGVATIRRRTGDTAAEITAGGTPAERLARRFWVYDIPEGPTGTVARILLRTYNLHRLPVNSFGELRFLHRMANNRAKEWIDDIPDGELGPAWQDREVTPVGVYFIRSFAGVTLLLRTDGHPSRMWAAEPNRPESVLAGHWWDVFPETGPITGAIGVSTASQEGSIELIFKSGAVHYVQGRWPQFGFGTLHNRAGLEGPRLVTHCPDGAVMWYGAGTIWRWVPGEGVPVDVGRAARKRIQRWLRRVNPAAARYGHAWVDERNHEVCFQLPIDDATDPDMVFVWDWRVQGFRRRSFMTSSDSLAIPGLDVVLLAGTFNSVANVYCDGHGYPGYTAAAPLARYTTGWVTVAGDSRPFQRPSGNLEEVVLTCEERHSGTGTLRMFADWKGTYDSTDGQNRNETFRLAHPESRDTIPYYGAATYGTDSWRLARTFEHRVVLDSERLKVAQVEISSTNPMAIMAMDAYVMPHALPGGDTPESP